MENISMAVKIGNARIGFEGYLGNSGLLTPFTELATINQEIR
jgi:hypothetical protein